jgi:hypothetical protein
MFLALPKRMRSTAPQEAMQERGVVRKMTIKNTSINAGIFLEKHFGFI